MAKRGLLPEPINLQEAVAFLFWQEESEQEFNKSPAAAASAGSELVIKLPTLQLEENLRMPFNNAGLPVLTVEDQYFKIPFEKPSPIWWDHGL